MCTREVFYVDPLRFLIYISKVLRCRYIPLWGSIHSIFIKKSGALGVRWRAPPFLWQSHRRVPGVRLYIRLYGRVNIIYVAVCLLLINPFPPLQTVSCTVN